MFPFWHYAFPWLGLADMQQEILRLKAALAAEQTRGTELRHRVNNELAAVRALLQLQADSKGHPEHCRTCVGRLDSVVELHRALDATRQPVVSMRPFLIGLVRSIRNAMDGPAEIQLECSDRIHLDCDRAIIVGLVLNEACTNALKYAYPTGRHGKITLALQESESAYAIAISDDGHGYDTGRHPEGLGTRLLQSFAQQLGGRLDVQSGKEGTRVTLTFPVVHGRAGSGSGA